MEDRIHYRRAFKSPYLSSADISHPRIFTIDHVSLEPDKTKRTKDLFNTAYFVEKEIRPGERMKPMILNVTNSKILFERTRSEYIADWNNLRVTIYVEKNVRIGNETTEGLRISAVAPEEKKLTPEMHKVWKHAKEYYSKHESFEKIEASYEVSDEVKKLLIAEVEDDKRKVLQRGPEQ
jgi:hypothetical protein